MRAPFAIRGESIHGAFGRELGDEGAHRGAVLAACGKSRGDSGYLWYLDYNGDGTVNLPTG